MPYNEFLEEWVRTVQKENILFDIHDFYAFLKELFGNMGYMLNEKKYDSSFNEESQTENYYLEWSCERKLTDYERSWIDVYITIKGKKGKMKLKSEEKTIYKGDVKIQIFPQVESDYEGTWKDSEWWANFFRDMYDYFFGKNKIIRNREEVGKDVSRLLRELNAYLQLHTQ